MPGPIDTAYVEFEARTDNLEREAEVAFVDVTEASRIMAEQVDRVFTEMSHAIIAQFEHMHAETANSFDGLAVGAERAGVAIDAAVGETTATAARDIDRLAVQAREDFNSIGVSAHKVGDEVGGMSGHMSTAISTMAGFVGGNVVMQGLSQAYQFAKGSVLGFNETLQNSGIAFTTMLGSAQKAQTFINQLQVFARTTPFEFQGLVQNAQRMMGMGIAAQDVIPDLTALGDSVASVGGSAEQINQVTLAFDQMAAKGTLDMGNMNQIMQGGVPNALKILADSYKVTTGEMINMISTGKVQSDVALPALIKGLEQGTKSVVGLGGMMAKQSQTMTGALSNIADGLQQAIAGAFKPFFDVAAAGAATLGNFFSGSTFTAFGQRVSSAMSRAFTSFSAFIHGINWSPLVNAIMTVWHIITDDLIPAGRSAAVTFGPIIVGAFQLMMAALAPLANTFKPVAAAIRDVFGFVEQHKTVFQAIAVSVLAVVAALKAYSVVQALITTATKVWTAAQIALDVAMDANPVGLIIIAIVALVAAIVYLWTHSSAFRKFFIGLWNDIWGFLKAIGAWFAGPFVNFFVSAWHFITGLPGKVMAALRALPGQLINLFRTGMARLEYDIGYFIGSIVKFFMSLPPRIWQILTIMWNQAYTLVFQGTQAIITWVEQLPGKIAGFFTDLWNGAVRLTRQGIDWVVGFVSSLPGRVIQFIENLWHTATSIFQSGVNAVVSFAQALPGRLWNAISSIPGLVWNTLSGLGSMLWNIGTNMVQSLIDGITHMMSWAVDQAKRAATNIAHGFMDALGIGSPSKVFMDIGKYTVQGYVQGVSREIDTAHQSVKQIVNPKPAVGDVASTPTGVIHHGFSGTVIVNVGGRQVDGAIVDILYDNPQHVALAAQQGERRLARR